MSSWYEPNPAPGLAITSAWGNAVEDASWPTYATKAALDAGWTAAPDGAHAFVLADRRTYERRGGAWLLPLTQPQGLVVSRTPGPPPATNFTPTVGAPGGQLGVFGPVSVRGKRSYLIGMVIRLQLSGAVANVSVGMHMNLRGTGVDGALTWTGGNAQFATGVEVIDAAFPLPWNGAVVKQVWWGSLATGGTDDAVLALNGQVVLNNTTAPITTSEAAVSFLDVGPAS